MPNLSKSICVFCGSKTGNDPVFVSMADQFAVQLAKRGHKLVYGGGSIGIMGQIANGVIRQGGHVTGVIPKFLDEFEVGHPDLNELILTENMHSRKEKMFTLSDGFVVFPGGLGTLEEFFEILTWKQLQLHKKPIVLFNQNNYWEPIVQMIDSVIDNGFAHEKCKELITVAHSIDEVFAGLENDHDPGEEVLTSHF